MTQRVECFCDRCDTRIEAARSLIRVETGPLRDRLPMFDLCERCQTALLGWLNDEDAKPRNLGPLEGPTSPLEGER